MASPNVRFVTTITLIRYLLMPSVQIIQDLETRTVVCIMSQDYVRL